MGDVYGVVKVAAILQPTLPDLPIPAMTSFPRAWTVSRIDPTAAVNEAPKAPLTERKAASSMSNTFRAARR